MSDRPKSPSRPTVRRLFALSGNRCAFSGCTTPLVDRETGSIVGEVCHIKGEKPTSARYDASQDNHARHGFDNLVVLCKTHHTVIDDNPNEYPVDRVMKMKEDHENRSEKKEAVDDATSNVFVSEAMNFLGENSEVVQVGEVSGGQFAHTINNYYTASSSGERVFRVSTHIGTHENVNVATCNYEGRPVAPTWLQATPNRLGSEWLVERLSGQADLQLCFDPKWSGGTWFVVDVQQGDGQVINHDQLGDLRPSPPTTTTAGLA